QRGHVSLARPRLILPFRYTPEGAILVRATVGDQSNLQLWVDTAAYTCVDPRRVNVDPEQVRPLPGRDGRQTDAGEYEGYYIGRVVVDGVAWSETPILTVRFPDYLGGDDATIDGCLGLDKLAFLTVTIDYQHRLLTFEPVSAFRWNRDTVPLLRRLLRRRGKIMVRAKLNGRRWLNLLLDTGSAYTFLRPPLARGLPHAPGHADRTIQTFAGREKVCFVKAKTLRIGRHRIWFPVLAVPQKILEGRPFLATADGIVGNDLLS